MEEVVDELAAAFSDGRSDRLVAFCDEPFALHLDQHLVYAPTRRFLARTLQRYRSLFGIRGVTARVVAIEIPRRNRFRTWIDWRYHRAADPRGVLTRSILYGRIAPGMLALEMAQFEHDEAQRNAGLLPARLLRS